VKDIRISARILTPFATDRKRRETSVRAPCGATAALRVASFMLPLKQQRFFEVHHPRAASSARAGMDFGRAALSFHTNQACSFAFRLAPSVTREPAGACCPV